MNSFGVGSVGCQAGFALVRTHDFTSTRAVDVSHSADSDYGSWQYMEDRWRLLGVNEISAYSASGFSAVIPQNQTVKLRVSKLGATLGTFITNPVTIFFIYPAQTFLVNRLLFRGSLTYAKLAETEWSWMAVRRLGAEVMASFFLGGFLFAIVLTPITYFVVKRFVVRTRARRQRRKAEISAQ